MNVIVDSSVWSLSLRRNNPNDGIEIINILRSLNGEQLIYSFEDSSSIVSAILFSIWNSMVSFTF